MSSKLERLRPSRWTIAARSAAISALVVLTALGIATAGLLALLQGSLLSGVDDAARARVSDIATALQTDGADQVDEALVATNQRIAVVQILDATGTVVRRSPGAPTPPVADPAAFGDALGAVAVHGDLRVNGEAITTVTGKYVVLVGGDTEAVEATVRTVAGLLAVAAPLVMAEAAYVSYMLIKRSLRSVDAIRARVAHISASDLSGRVPVPRSSDEIAALAVTMNEMLDRIEKSHLAQRQFVGDASHELRSPLTTILSALEVVEWHPHLLNDELVSETLLPEAHRMKVLVEDLLLLARADEHQLTPGRDDVDIDGLIAEEVERLRVETSVAIETTGAGLRIVGDASGLSRMLRNLLDNAARHARTRIEITSVADGQNAVVCIGDDGPGIPIADRQRVFDRFVRLDADRSRGGGGTGLGLAIVAEIVASHGGSIEVGDRPGGGTRLTVRLPLRQ